MLTPSVNVVQSAFPEEKQGEISGLSRCISNLGSSLGTAVAGTILVAGLSSNAYGSAMLVLALLALGRAGGDGAAATRVERRLGRALLRKPIIGATHKAGIGANMHAKASPNRPSG